MSFSEEKCIFYATRGPDKLPQSYTLIPHKRVKNVEFVIFLVILRPCINLHNLLT